MTEKVPEFPEITVSDEEDQLILELKSEVKFLREALMVALRNQVIDHGKLPVRTVPLSPPVETVITDFNEAKDYLENHYYQEAEKAKAKKEKNNEANPKS